MALSALSTDTPPTPPPNTAGGQLARKLARWLAPYQLDLLADALALIDTLGQGEGEITLVLKGGKVQFIRPAPSIDARPKTPEELRQTQTHRPA